MPAMSARTRYEYVDDQGDERIQGLLLMPRALPEHGPRKAWLRGESPRVESKCAGDERKGYAFFRGRGERRGERGGKRRGDDEKEEMLIMMVVHHSESKGRDPESSDQEAYELKRRKDD